MADLTGLEWAFNCPTDLDPVIEAGYETLRLRLQMELAQHPITTTAAIRAERILNYYVRLKDAEKRPYGDAEDCGFANPAEEQTINAFLKGLLKDWDDVIIKAKPSGQDAALKVEKQFKQIFVDCVAATEMPGAIRNELMERLTHTTVMAGLDHG
jgi:hypothetical protein